MPIGSLHSAQQLRALSREMLPATQQLADRRIGRRSQCLPLLGIQTSPLGLVAGGQKGALLRLGSHGINGTRRRGSRFEAPNETQFAAVSQAR
jgi:hypothetical protein